MIPFLDFLSPIIEKALNFIPDPKMKMEAQQKLAEELNRHSEEILKALTLVDTAQIQVNQEEAKSSNLFISGGRPAITWICASAFGWTYVIQPFLSFILASIGHPVKDLPVLNLSEMMPVLLGILGLAGMRTWEKSQNVQDRH
jgi:hypothetical protein